MDAAERPIYAGWVAGAVERGVYQGFFIEKEGEVATFHRPHPAKEAKRYQVRDARDFLDRMGMPVQIHSPESLAGRALLASVEGKAEFPILSRAGRPPLSRPTLAQVAESVSRHT